MSLCHNSRSWLKLRAEKLSAQPLKYREGHAQGDNFCESCGNVTESPQVHHIAYATNSDDRLIVPLSSLVILCCECHQKAHRNDGRAN